MQARLQTFLPFRRVWKARVILKPNYFLYGLRVPIQHILRLLRRHDMRRLYCLVSLHPFEIYSGGAVLLLAFQ